MTELMGRTLSKVEIKQRLGRGGMGDIYLGQHTTLNRPVALKILHSFLSEDPKNIQRFRIEAQAVAALRHPNIVQVFDFDLLDGQPYFVMELVDGMPLDSYLKAVKDGQRRLPPETVARLLLAIAAALDYAHARGIVHRDIKPGNIILRRELLPGVANPAQPAIDPAATLALDVEPILTDFGVAHFAQTAQISVSGSVSGTPAYFSPEQCRGEAVDARSDIYSLGVMTYEMLSGRLPFELGGESQFGYIYKHLFETPLALPEAGPEASAVVMRAMAKEKEQRYASASEFANALMAAVFGGGRTWARADALPRPPVEGLLDALSALIRQAEAYEYTIPPSNYTARAAVLMLGELARSAQSEAQDLAASFEPVKPGPHPFSRREFEVLGLVGQGMTSKEIAYRLGVSERTIEYHINSIFNKTGAQTRMEAVSIALHAGWIKLANL
jgi:serine/threonine protein kinase/DNA-binding CsgD family transcriptional regulator